MTDGFTVTEAAERTGHSVQTIRRRMKDGALKEVEPKTSPKRLTVESVNAERALVLLKLGVTEGSAPDQAYASVDQLRAALASLTRAHAHLAQTLLHLADLIGPGTDDGATGLL